MSSLIARIVPFERPAPEVRPHTKRPRIAETPKNGRTTCRWRERVPIRWNHLIETESASRSADESPQGQQS
jgi:hypothetical protein